MGIRDGQALSAGRRGWLCGAVAAAAIGLAGCGGGSDPGNAAATGTPAPTGPASQARSLAGGPLCANAGAVDRLTVSRVNTIPANHPHFAFPAMVTVTDAVQARTAAQALCALRPEPGGVLTCPADLGISYRLDFATPKRSLPAVTIRAGGCEGISGAGLTRSSMRTPAFWAVLGRAMGLTHPSHAVFAGSMQS
jgi:hypothetical protein